MYFNVIRSLISDISYCYFISDNGMVYEGFDLPKELDELFITDISGGEDEHGCCLYFECVETETYKRRVNKW